MKATQKYFLLTVSTLSVCTFIMISEYHLMSSSFTPPALRTGAPGENTCTGCHSGIVNNGNGIINLDFPDTAGYIPGNTYTLNLSNTETGMFSRFGFEITALDANNVKVGNFIATNTTNTSIQNVGGRQYINHKAANSNKNWTFNWQAPTTNVGDIKFYIAAVSANSNNANSGDKTYNSVKMISFKNVNNINEKIIEYLKVYPNPATNKLNFDIQNPSKIYILDINGKTVLSSFENVQSLDISALPSGNYFLNVIDNKQNHFEARFIKK